jgi:transposase
MSFIGADVAKDFVVFFVSGQIVQVPNQAKALRRFLRGKEPGRLAMESTGRYHLLLAHLAHQAGFTVYVVNPREFCGYRKSAEFRIKSDASDAALLARFADKEHDRLLPWLPPSQIHVQAQALLRLRAVLVRSRTAMTLSLGSMRQAKVEHAILALTESIKDLEDKIVALMQNERGYARLVKIPGVGPLTAAAMVLAYSKGHFASSDAFVAFLGLDLRFSDSGKRQGRRRLSKRGDPLCRFLLYNAASSAIRNTNFKPAYERYLERGMARIQAIVAIARKLARTCWSILRHDTAWNPQRLCTQA